MAKSVMQEATLSQLPTTPADPSRVEVGRWNGHVFEVSTMLVYSFSDLQIKASINTKEKSKSKQKYVARKSAKPVEVTITVTLNILLGCDVRYEAEGFVSDAKAGKNDYFYVGNDKLIPAKLMLTDATISDIEITPKGTWTKAVAKLTFKQGSKNDKKPPTRTKKTMKNSGGWMKTSVKRTPPQTTKKPSSSSQSASSLLARARKAEQEARRLRQLAKQTTLAKKRADALRRARAIKK